MAEGAATERSVSGRIALVTGASRGLGLALATHLVKRGAKVIVSGRSAATLDAVASQLNAVPVGNKETHGKAFPCACDVTSIEDVQALADFVATHEQLGHLDMLAINHGVMPGLGLPVPMVQSEDEVACIQTNLIGAHLVAKLMLPLLLKAPAGFERTIVFTTSCEGWLSEPTEANGLLAYRASKSGVQALMLGLHGLYVGNSNPVAVMMRGGAGQCLHRVLSVHPGYVATGLGVEAAHAMGEPDLSHEDFAARKMEEGDHVSVEVGVKPLLHPFVAADGLIQSGKTYDNKQPHSF